jgi:hypothetical protein
LPFSVANALLYGAPPPTAVAFKIHRVIVQLEEQVLRDLQPVPRVSKNLTTAVPCRKDDAQIQ